MRKDEAYHQNFLSQYSEIVNKSEFKKIFSNFKFKQVLQQHTIKDGYHDLYIIGYESNKCRLGFFYEVGNLFYIAITFAETDLWDKYEWVGLEYLVSYLKKKPIIRGEDRTFEERINIKTRLHEMYEEFNPLSIQAISLFQNKEKVSSLRLLLGEYIKEDTRHKYNVK